MSRDRIAKMDMALNFRYAVFSRNYARMREILNDKRFDINFSINSNHIMFDVIESGNLAAAKIIIESASVDYSSKDALGHTLKEYARELNEIPILRMLEHRS